MQECLSHVRDRKRKEAVGCCRPCKEGHPSDPLLYTPATGTVGMMVILREEESLHRAVRAVPPLTIFIPSENTATTPFQGAMQPVEETTLGTLFTKGCILRPKGEDTGCRFTMQPQACPPPMFITCCKVLSITAVRGDKAKNIFYGYMPPMFENICGSAISFRGPEQFNGHCVKKTKTSFGDCHEMFTVYGNVAMRKVRAEICWHAKRPLRRPSIAGQEQPVGNVSFKGARDVRMIAGVVKDLMGIESLFNQQTCVGGHDFNVHMAVVTSLLGKKLSVHSGCTLERIISEVSHGIEILPR